VVVDAKVAGSISASQPLVNDETKSGKIITRAVAGVIMSLIFAMIIRGGALYCIFFGIVTQIELFRELVNVRYVEAKQKSIPLFRTLQWTWFVLAMFYTYGENFHNFCFNHGHLRSVTRVTQYLDIIVFSLYCLLFIATVLTFKTGLIKFQLGQMLWTLATVALVVLQTKFLCTCALYGVFWFCFPMATVVSNDVFAYICGMLFGKKIFQAPFLSLSPKKTWEGFIGAAIVTCVFSFYAPLILADIPWLVCPSEKISFFPQNFSCNIHPIFLPREYVIPTLGLLGSHTVTLLPIQLHGVAFGAFASLVAPFGGFLASAIKRGYDIKDFETIIPGHGGFMDRMDCQLIIHLYTYIHVKSFVMSSVPSVTSILSSAALLSHEDLQLLYSELARLLQQK